MMKAKITPEISTNARVNAQCSTRQTRGCIRSFAMRAAVPRVLSSAVSLVLPVAFAIAALGTSTQTAHAQASTSQASTTQATAPQASPVACHLDRVRISGDFGAISFHVEVADDPNERAQGLMHRTQLPSTAGMLFVYDAPQPVAFWMKNTLIPLDLLFVDRRGIITQIHENAVPHDLTPIPSRAPALAVLEIGGGLASKFGLGVGDVLMHPAFGEDAQIPCP